MPPKPKFTKGQVVEAAYEMVRDKGIEGFSVRNLAKCLNTTGTPFFTLFESSDEIKKLVYKRVKDELLSFMEEAFKYDYVFKEYGFRWIKYAKNNLNFYKMIFHNTFSEEALEIKEAFANFSREIIKVMAKTFSLNDEDAMEVNKCLVLQVEGIVLRILNGQDFTDEEILHTLGVTCLGIVNLIKIRNGEFDQNMATYMSQHVDIVPKKIK